MKITINKVTRYMGMCRLYISGRENYLAVSEFTYHRHRLKEGIVITSPQLQQLIEDSKVDTCDYEVARLLGLREHSIGEIRAKLVRKGHASNTINAVQKKYIADGLLDDERYAFNLARYTLERKPVGRPVLIATLMKKHIDRELAERTVVRLLGDTDESDSAQAALRRKWRQYSQFDLETARRKAYSYLSRQGFSYDAARAAFEAVAESAEEVNEDQNG